MSRKPVRKQRPRNREASAREQPAPAPAPPATIDARIALALGALAMIALPIAYQWTFRPATRPAGAEGIIQILELGGVIAAVAALVLGRRARAAGDRSKGAVWAPRLGGAAIVGYAMTLVVLLTRGG